MKASILLTDVSLVPGLGKPDPEPTAGEPCAAFISFRITTSAWLRVYLGIAGMAHWRFNEDGSKCELSVYGYLGSCY